MSQSAANDDQSRNDLDEYIIISGNGRKSRHRPISDDVAEPACEITRRREDTTWKRVDARQTIFHDDCGHCFGRGNKFAQGDA